MAPDPPEEPPSPRIPLSPREIEILQKIATGASSSDVAEQLGLSFGTVKRAVARIMEKLGAHDRAIHVARAWARSSPVRPPMAVRLCEEHPSCYQVLLRNIAGSPAGPSDEWHFAWSRDQSRWRLRCPARNVLIDRNVPDGVSPTVALLGAIPGTKLSHIGKQIEKLGFPPPDWTTRTQPPDMSPG